MDHLSQLSAGTFLADDDPSIDAHPHLWGFGGLHGGLLLGRATAAVQRHLDGAPVRSITGQYHRATRTTAELSVAPTRAGRRLVTASSRIVDGDGVTMTAAFVAGPAHDARPTEDDTTEDDTTDEGQATFGPVAPPAPPPSDCATFSIPPAFVPSAAQVELRPVGSARPFAGGDEPALTAWIRLVEDDLAPDLPRLVFLLDSLAPAHSAVLTTPALLPTVELTVHPTDALPRLGSPWVLLAARSTAVRRGGWVTEQIDAWDVDGRHLATAHQLRLLRPA